MGRAHEKWHICKCLIFHAKNLLKVYNQKNSGYTKSRRKIRQQKIPKIDSKFLHIELLSREAWTSKDTRFLTLSEKATEIATNMLNDGIPPEKVKQYANLNDKQWADVLKGAGLSDSLAITLHLTE